MVRASDGVSESLNGVSVVEQVEYVIERVLIMNMYPYKYVVHW